MASSISPIANSPTVPTISHSGSMWLTPSAIRIAAIIAAPPISGVCR